MMLSICRTLNFDCILSFLYVPSSLVHTPKAYQYYLSRSSDTAMVGCVPSFCTIAKRALRSVPVKRFRVAALPSVGKGPVKKKRDCVECMRLVT